MSKHPGTRKKPGRLGNSFPWRGILAGVRRMFFYLLLLACLLVGLGIIVLVGMLLTDNEPVKDYF